MEANGVSEDFLAFLYFYLKQRKQSVNNSNAYHSMFQIILSDVPQGS